MRQFGQMGLLGLTVPAEHGGGAQHANPTDYLTRTRTSCARRYPER